MRRGGAPGGGRPVRRLGNGPVDDPDSCPPRVGFVEAEDSESDATGTGSPPAPTSKGQYRNGVYRDFGFDNQGQRMALSTAG
jgi:hypothetical protein